MCLCLNTGIDAEEWREEVWRDVPVARKECGLNFWEIDQIDNPGRIGSLFLETFYVLIFAVK